MKIEIKLVCMVLLLILASCGKGQYKTVPCVPTAISNHVLAFYSFSNGSLNDLSGNNHHLTNSSTASSTSDRNGNLNCAFLFDNLPASNEFLSVSNTNFLNGLSEFSISLWYQPLDTTRAGSDFEGLIQRGEGFSCPDRMGQWSVGLYDCRRAVFGRANSVWDQNISNNVVCQDEINLRTNQWHHLVATYTTSGSEMKIYRNGYLQSVSNGTGGCMAGIPAVQDFGDLFIGKQFTGKVDDVIILNKKVNQQEVTNLYNMTTCCN